MSPRRVLVSLVLVAAAALAPAVPAAAAKPLPPPPEITSAVGPIYTSATTARITGLYPGDLHTFYVVAETRRNSPLGTTEWVYVATPPEGPSGTLGWVDALDGYVRIWSGSGIGCVTQDLGILADDGTYTSLGDGTDQGGPRTWTIYQGLDTTETYAVRCQGSGGLWSPWSEPPTVVTLTPPW